MPNDYDALITAFQNLSEMIADVSDNALRSQLTVKINSAIWQIQRTAGRLDTVSSSSSASAPAAMAMGSRDRGTRSDSSKPCGGCGRGRG